MVKSFEKCCLCFPFITFFDRHIRYLTDTIYKDIAIRDTAPETGCAIPFVEQRAIRILCATENVFTGRRNLFICPYLSGTHDGGVSIVTTKIGHGIITCGQIAFGHYPTCKSMFEYRHIIRYNIHIFAAGCAGNDQ
ncbi:hypothetical protein D3C81_1660730 [compost metagenome]